MELSAAGWALLKSSEGFRAQTYRDVNGYATIGYGHRLLQDDAFPNGIDEAMGEHILLSDVDEAEEAVEGLVKVALTQGQFDALVDFTFNLGEGRLAASTLLKILNHGNYADAGAQLLRWDIAGGEENAGLKARRLAEYALWNQAA